jgi:hypothetical protein
MSENRIQNFETFFSYYLGEHAVPLCRVLHFTGTTVVVGLLVTTIAAAAQTHPLWLVPALFGAFVSAFVGNRVERRMPAFIPILAFIACLAPLHPWAVLSAVVAGYGFAWPAHFVVEKNRPATFKYPIWSLASDFRMWGLMLRGKLWSSAPVHEQAGVPAFSGPA